LSIGALTLVGKPPATSADVSNDVLGFGFSFIILISVWLRYTGIMSILPLQTMTSVRLNIAMLFLVSIEPYLLSLLNSTVLPAVFDFASVAYAIDLAGIMIILGLFTHMLIREENKLPAVRLISKQKRNRNALLMSAVLFLISTLPQFLVWRFEGTPIRIWFWYVPLIVLWSLRLPRMDRRDK
jgi:uncharacterized membrane protein